MDVIDGFVAIGFMATLISSVYLYLRYQAVTSRELEEYRQMKISERAQNRPKEWWQEVFVNLSNQPGMVDKLLPLIGNVNLQTLLQNFLQKKM